LIALVPSQGMAQKIELDDIPIGWNDFQGTKAPRAEHTAAHISFGISYGYTSIPITRNKHKLAFRTKINLLRDKSWLNRDTYARLNPQKRQNLLNHEKGHFIIGLIYYKELVQAFNKREYTGNIKRQTRHTFNKINSKMDRYNNEYDKDTKHGSARDKQQQWNNRLLKQLNQQYSRKELRQMEF